MDSKVNQCHRHSPAPSSLGIATPNFIQSSVQSSVQNSAHSSVQNLVLTPEPRLFSRPSHHASLNLGQNQKGQGLVEYLIIVALMGVATITVMRDLQGTVSNRFAHIASALQSKTIDFNEPELRKDLSKQKDMGSFFKNADMKSNSSAGNDSN